MMLEVLGALVCQGWKFDMPCLSGKGVLRLLFAGRVQDQVHLQREVCRLDSEAWLRGPRLAFVGPPKKL